MDASLSFAVRGCENAATWSHDAIAVNLPHMVLPFYPAVTAPYRFAGRGPLRHHLKGWHDPVKFIHDQPFDNALGASLIGRFGDLLAIQYCDPAFRVASGVFDSDPLHVALCWKEHLELWLKAAEEGKALVIDLQALDGEQPD